MYFLASEVAGEVFFFAYDPMHGWEPRVTDGTPEGTHLFRDIDDQVSSVPENARMFRSELVDLDGTLLFPAWTADFAEELWRSDGTEAGTELVSDIDPSVYPSVDAPFSGDSWPRDLVRIGDRIVFSAQDPDHGRELWTSDGTPGGTALLADVRPGTDSSWPRRAIAGSWNLFFWADDGATGVEPWTTDGTPVGTHRLADLEPGPGSSYTMTWTSAATALYGELFFSAFRASEGVELWRSDGTEGGTTLFQDVNPGPGSSSPDSMTMSNGRMVFTANDGVHGFELWAASMAPPGVRLLLTVTGGFHSGGTVVYALILENTGDFALIDGPGSEVEMPVPSGLVVLSTDADRGEVLLQQGGGTVAWSGSVPPRGAVTIEVVARVGDLPIGTSIAASASATFDSTGDGISEPAVASDDPATAEDDDATTFVLGASVPEVPVLSLPGLIALASLLAGAASRKLRRRHPAPGRGASGPSSTAR